MLLTQRKYDKAVTLVECIRRVRECSVRADLIILLVRHELPLIKHDRTGIYGNLVAYLLKSHNGMLP